MCGRLPAVSMYAACAAKKLRTALKRASARYGGAEEPADPNAEAANNAPAEPADEEGGAAEETYAAQIGENGYATLAEALAAMQDGDTVTLLKDVEESFTLETNGTIDLNNKTLIGEIIIKADVVFRTGEIAQKSGQETAAVVLINSGSLKLEDTYINAGEYGGILVTRQKQSRSSSWEP